MEGGGRGRGHFDSGAVHTKAPENTHKAKVLVGCGMGGRAHSRPSHLKYHSINFCEVSHNFK